MRKIFPFAIVSSHLLHSQRRGPSRNWPISSPISSTAASGWPLSSHRDYFYGIATSVPKLGEGDSERLRAHFFWGIIALFVMFSVWGILALLRNTLFGGDTGLPGSTSNQVLCNGLDDCQFP